MIVRTPFQHKQLPSNPHSFLQILYSTPLLVHLLKQNFSLGTFHEPNIDGAEKFKKGVTKVFTQTDESTGTVISPTHSFVAFHVYFSNPENFAHNPAT